MTFFGPQKGALRLTVTSDTQKIKPFFLTLKKNLAWRGFFISETHNTGDILLYTRGLAENSHTKLCLDD